MTGWGWAGRCSAFWRPRRANSSPAAAASSRPRSHASPPRSETENFSWNKRQFIIKACRKLQHFNANTQSSRALNYFQSSDLYGPINSHYIHAPRYFSILEYSCILTARGKDSTSSMLCSLSLYYAATCGPRHVFVLTLTGHCSLSVESVFPRYRRLAHGPRGPRPAGLGCRPRLRRSPTAVNAAARTSACPHWPGNGLPLLTLQQNISTMNRFHAENNRVLNSRNGERKHREQSEFDKTFDIVVLTEDLRFSAWLLQTSSTKEVLKCVKKR